MGTGPKAESGYDLALTEILDGEHRLLVEVGSERGSEILRELPARPAEHTDLDAAARTIVAEAFERGSHDNLTVLLARVDALPEREVSEVLRQNQSSTGFCPVFFRRKTRMYSSTSPRTIPFAQILIFSQRLPMTAHPSNASPAEHLADHQRQALRPGRQPGNDRTRE